MNQPIIYPPQLVFELLEWLEPVGKNTPEFIEQMQTYANELVGTTPTINTYYCKNGHDTVTIDRDGIAMQKTIPCPFCQAEARSIFYMCDQKRLPTHEFYLPADYLAFPPEQRRSFKNGGLAFKNIYATEPSRLSTKIKITQ